MFKDELKLVPHLPGSYQMIDKNGIVIYVGKAKDLNKRLHSYFRGNVTGKTALMVQEVDHFTYIVTKTETESFILELNLIKEYDPKYNILLKDDKTYPYIEFISKPYPALKVVRYTKLHHTDKKKIFGPYPNAYAARRIVNLINRLYPLKKCEGMPKKECLYYHIGECLGYCIKNINQDNIINMENEILSFLRGNDSVLINKINNKINTLSQSLNFEKALEIKKELDYIKVVLDKQKVELHDFINRDVISYYYLNGYLSIQIFFIRNGKLLGGHSNILNAISDASEEANYYVFSFYQNHEKPQELLVDKDFDTKILSELLNVKVVNITKGKKKELINMAYINAKITLEREFDAFMQSEKRTIGAHNRLKEILKLPSLNRIEIFDNAHLFGSYTVSGLVVFKNGKPCKNEYRKYKISVDQNDDYHTMKEVIYRRYYRQLLEKKELPDLIIVDGGNIQINACLDTLKDLGLKLNVVGLKKDDKHRTQALISGKDLSAIPLDNEKEVFNYLTRMQDEVHRFTISYHKQIRNKGSLASVLANVEGIGLKRQKALLKRFSNLNKIKDSSLKELKEILPNDVAINLQHYLKELLEEQDKDKLK